MDLEWKAEYLTGVEEVDDQHHYFVALINRLQSDLGGEEDVTLQTNLLNELIRYAAFHFLSEENLMRRVGIAATDLERHRRLHRELLNEVGELVFHVEYGEQSPLDIVHFVVRWFLHHTTREDVALFEPVRQARARQRAAV